MWTIPCAPCPSPCPKLLVNSVDVGLWLPCPVGSPGASGCGRCRRALLGVHRRGQMHLPTSIAGILSLYYKPPSPLDFLEPMKIPDFRDFTS